MHYTIGWAPTEKYYNLPHSFKKRKLSPHSRLHYCQSIRLPHFKPTQPFKVLSKGLKIRNIRQDRMKARGLIYIGYSDPVLPLPHFCLNRNIHSEDILFHLISCTYLNDNVNRKEMVKLEERILSKTQPSHILHQSPGRPQTRRQREQRDIFRNQNHDRTYVYPKKQLP